MAAGLGFKTFATGDVLSATDVNGYLMQGVLVFASATARDAAITSPQEGQTVYLKDTDVIQSYSGSAWVTKSGGSPLTTKGDLYTYSTTDARLAVGTNGYVLTADSTESTGLKWAAASSGGGMTLLSTTTLSGASTSITVSSNSYNELWVYGYGISPSAELDMIIRLNANSGSTDYVNNSNWSANGTGGTYYGKNNGIYLNAVGSGGWGSGLTDNTFVMRIPNCNSTYRKVVNVISQYNQGSTSPNVNTNTAMAAAATSAVASIQVAVPSGSINAGTVKVYGIA